MLRINVIASPQQARNYFNEHLSKGDYYQKDQAPEIPSLWSGKAAERMGLSGTVSQRDYEALIDHRNPVTGEQLTQRRKENRRIGYDLTFSVPKSVSVYHAGTGDDRVLTAFRESVQETMQEMEQDVKVRVRQQGQTQGERVTGNALWSSFLHHESRPVEGKPCPHLHEHVVLYNVTWDALYQNRDGTAGAWMAADIVDLKRNAPYYQAAMDARLAGKLTDLGLAVRQSPHGFELQGFTQSMKETYSRRTALIEQRAEQLGVQHVADKADLGRKTREAKPDNLSVAEMRQEWRSRLSDREWDSFLSQAQAGGTNNVNEREALDYGFDHLLERQSVARERDVLAAALRRGVGSVTPKSVRQEFAQREDVVAATEQGERLVTTKAVLAEEAAMIAFARDGRGTQPALGSNSFRFRPIQRGGQLFGLSGQQKQAVSQILESNSRVVLVRGAAGTGKTSLMAEAIRGIEENGRRVQTFAPTSDATDVLRRDGNEAGIPSLQQADTVAKLLQSKKGQAHLRGQVILIDEAGLLSSRDLKGVFDVAKQQQARVILAGDYKQHASVVRGDAMRILVSQAGLKPAEVTEVRRQRNAAYRAAVESLSQGTRREVAAGFDRLDEMGLIQEVTDADERNNQLATGYVSTVQAGQTALIVSPTHGEGAQVTEKVRDRLKQAGLLSGSERTFQRLNNLNLTDAEKSNPHAYACGQVVQFHKPSQVIPSSTMEVETVLGMGPHGPTLHKQFEQNSRKTVIGYNWKGETGLQRVAPVQQGLTYGSRATVLGRDTHGNVHVRTDAGEVVHLPLQESAKFSVYQPTEINVAAGDTLRVTQNGYTRQRSRNETKHRLTNGGIYRVAGFTHSGDIRLDNGWVIDRNNGHFTHGYVTTSHASQGKSRDVVFVAQSTESFPASNRAQWYVSVSRAKQATIVLTDDKETLRNQAILRSSERMAATELAAGAAQQQQPQGVQAETERVARQRSFMVRLNQMAKQAREAAAQKARQLRAQYDRMREQWKERGHGYERG